MLTPHRLIYSSKFGKLTQLKPVMTAVNTDPKSLFLDSLICSKSLVSNTFDIETMEPSDQKKIMNGQKKVISLISNFPQIDHFVQSLIGNGQISKLSLFEKTNTNQPMVVYNIKNYNFCQNVGRSHKSNTIYYIADIKRGE